MSSSTDSMRIDGDAGDIVRRGTGWTTGADQGIGANTYHTYTKNGTGEGTPLATLLVDTDVTSVQAYT